MTTTNVLGIRNNNTIIPYTGTTKSTKQLSLVKTTDITAAVVAGTALDAGYTVTTSVRFHADSAGVWKMSIQGEIAAGGAGTNRTGIVITFVKASIKFMTTMQGPASAVPNIGTIVDAFAIKNTNTVEIDTSSGTASVWSFSGDFVLAQEPTDYTTVAANMEGVVAVDVFVPSAAAGIQGLVDNRVANTGGTPILGKTAAGAVAAGYVGEELESIATVATNTNANFFNVASTDLTAGTWLVSGHLRAIMKTSFALFQGSIGTTSATGEEIRAASGQHMGGAANGEYSSFQLCPKIVNTTGATIYLNSVCVGANDCSITGTLNCVRIA